mmetsp:Transcript_15876/g.43845  ORF Transcript_15876/g.43845 Transcript_15876/m.43845 type:complete len:211 (-) Transcript_15876:221-853(-)
MLLFQLGPCSCAAFDIIASFETKHRHRDDHEATSPIRRLRQRRQRLRNVIRHRREPRLDAARLRTGRGNRNDETIDPRATRHAHHAQFQLQQEEGQDIAPRRARFGCRQGQRRFSHALVIHRDVGNQRGQILDAFLAARAVDEGVGRGTKQLAVASDEHGRLDAGILRAYPRKDGCDSAGTQHHLVAVFVCSGMGRIVLFYSTIEYNVIK